LKYGTGRQPVSQHFGQIAKTIFRNCLELIMNLMSNPPANPFRRHLTTAEVASALSLREQSIRKKYCLEGSFHGVVPKKLGGRLYWPADTVETLLGEA